MNKKPELHIKPLMIRGGLPHRDFQHESSKSNITATTEAQSKKTERGYAKMYASRPEVSDAVSFDVETINSHNIIRHYEAVDPRLYNLPNTKTGVSRHAFKQAMN